MAKFTSTADLNLRLPGGFEAIGVAGTTHRIPDALVTEFERDHAPSIPGFAWVVIDEMTTVPNLPIGQTDVSGLTAALAAKYDKTGGTISGAATVTGTLGVGGATTLSSTLSAGATTTGALVVQGAATVTSTAVIQGAATVGGSLAAQNNLNVTNTATATDVIASGIIVAGNSASVVGKLKFGGVLQAGGTAFPGSPADNDQFYRTDLDLWFFYDGTRWLSTTLFDAEISNLTAQSLTATQLRHGYSPAPVSPGSDIWLVDIITQFFVSGGTALSGSHKWVGVVEKHPTDNSDTTLVTVNIDSGSSSVWRTNQQTVGALMNNGTTHFTISTDWTKTGTPGTLFAFVVYRYRIVAT